MTGCQFLLILFIRFAYRFVLLERSKRTRELQKCNSLVLLFMDGLREQSLTGKWRKSDFFLSVLAKNAY